MAIHPTAVVDKRAELDADVEVGAYAIVEGGVRIGAGSRLWPHAFVSNGTTLGQRVQVHPFAVVGHWPQDVKYSGAPSYATVGDETIIREHASIHRGTEPESKTVVGRRCFIMSTGHVGHNCVLGDDVKVANSALLSGHCHVGAGAFISGNVSVHQFVRIGELAMIGGGSAVSRDVPPFMLFAREFGVSGYNRVGMKRAGFTPEELNEIRTLYRIAFRSGRPFRPLVEQAVATARTPAGLRFVAFLQRPSKRGMGRFRGARVGSSSPDEAGA